MANIRRPSGNTSFFGPENGSRVLTWAAHAVFDALTVYDNQPGRIPRDFLRQFVDAMGGGDCVVILPEGTVFAERNTLWGRFERGTVVSVEHAQRVLRRRRGRPELSIPILPAWISYQRLAERDQGAATRPEVHFRFGRPVSLDECGGTSIERTQLLRQLVCELSEESERCLTYEELRAFDDQDFCATKVPVRTEMLGKDLLEIADTSPEVIRGLLVGKMLSGADGARETTLGFLVTLGAYVASSGNGANTAAAQQLQALTEALSSGRWGAAKTGELLAVLGNERIYDHERTILPGQYQVLKVRLRALCG